LTLVLGTGLADVPTKTIVRVDLEFVDPEPLEAQFAHDEPIRADDTEVSLHAAQSNRCSCSHHNPNAG
jgi:hypothetical protein